MKQYFITIYTTAPKNKLQRMVQDSFLYEFEHKLMPSDKIESINTNYEKIVEQYQLSGGKAKLDDLSIYNTGCGKGFSIGDSIRINLTLVKGEIE